jgi:hypothetical protein
MKKLYESTPQMKWYYRNKDKCLGDIATYYQDNKEKRKAYIYAWRKTHKDSLYFTFIKVEYGVTKDQYYKILKYQKNKCPICKTDFSKVKRRPCVDHDHKTGEFRGILCQRCNSAMHYFDNMTMFKSLVKYKGRKRNVS